MSDERNMHRFRYSLATFLIFTALVATFLEATGRFGSGLPFAITATLLIALLALVIWQFLEGEREMRDEIERRRAELELKTDEIVKRGRYEATLLASLSDGVVACDANGEFVYVNEAAMKLQGFSPDEIPLEHFRDTRKVVEDDGVTPIPSDETPLRRCLREGDLQDQRVKFVHRDGSVRDAHYNARRIVGADGEVLGAVLIFRDITEHLQLVDELRRERERMAHLAEHDELTGLYNRRVFERRLEDLVALAGRYGPSGALLMIDIDNLKDVNDMFGHAAGDELITAVAHAMRDRLRETDVLCRIGGDEFAVLLPRADREHALAAAEALLKCIGRRSVELGDEARLRPAASIGVTVFDDFESPGTSEVKAAADSAMYEAKRRGRNRAVLADGERDQWRTGLRLA